MFRVVSTTFLGARMKGDLGECPEYDEKFQTVELSLPRI